MREIAKPKLDLVFKKIFGDVNNKDLLVDFLSSVLDIPVKSITKVEIIDNEVIPDTIEKKFCRLDLLVQLNKDMVNIEIQVNNYNNFKERTLFYWSKVYANQLIKNENYNKLKNTIAINIVDFNLFDCPEYHSSFGIYEANRHEKLTDKLRIDFLELPKAKKYKTNNRLQEWLDFLNVTTEEGLDMIDKNNTNPEVIGKAVAVVRQMSADEKLLREIQRREDTAINEFLCLSGAREEGLEKGRKEGRKEGIEEGRQQVRDKLKAKGFTDEQIKDLLDEE